MRKQRGQSMVEYVIVVAFGILVISGAGGVIDELIGTVQDSYRGYSYAVSLSQVPDYADVDGAEAACLASGSPPSVCSFLTDPSALTSKIETFKTSYESVKSALGSWKDPPSIDPLDYFEPPSPRDIFCFTTGFC